MWLDVATQRVILEELYTVGFALSLTRRPDGSRYGHRVVARAFILTISMPACAVSTKYSVKTLTYEEEGLPTTEGGFAPEGPLPSVLAIETEVTDDPRVYSFFFALLAGFLAMPDWLGGEGPGRLHHTKSMEHRHGFADLLDFHFLWDAFASRDLYHGQSERSDSGVAGRMADLTLRLLRGILSIGNIFRSSPRVSCRPRLQSVSHTYSAFPGSALLSFFFC